MVAREVTLCVLSFAAFSVIWGKVLHYSDEKSTLIRALVFRLMGYSTRTAAEIKAIVLTLIYVVFGGVGITGFSWVYGLGPGDLFRPAPNMFFIIVLGILASMSLSSLLVSVMFTITPLRVDPIRVMQEVPWIEGIYRLPPRVRRIVPAVSGFIEESFFRGVCLLILVNRLDVQPWVALAIVSILFVGEQMLQTRTWVQALMIAIFCIAISLVGGLLVFLTNSVTAAALVHASYVVFYFNPPTSR